jgi:fatty acid desaturase
MTDSDAIRTLRREFVARGWTRLPTARAIAELAANVLMTLGGIAIIVFCDHWALKALGLLIVTCGSMGVGANTHTSSHDATSKRKWVNEALTYFGFPFFLGLPATYWWWDHVSVHHVSHNVLSIDDDFDLRPFFAITQPHVDQSRGFAKFYYSHLQIWFLPFALFFFSFMFQFVAWKYLLHCTLDPKQRTRRQILDLTSLILHYGVWLALPCIWLPFWSVLLFYVLRAGLMGYAQFIVLGPGHFPLEAELLETRPPAKDYMRFQTDTCVNFHTGPFGRLICAGLEYHIEHHLFPEISHVYYPKVAKVLRKFCQDNGYQYQTFSWPRAVWKCVEIFVTPKPLVAGNISERAASGV